MIVDLPSTTTAAVSKKLVRLRNDVGAMALGRVLTLLIIADESDADEAIEAANDASRQHPCRIIAIVTGNKRGASRLDAQIRVGGDAGASEVVVLRLYGALADHGDSVVIPLLLPDSPVVAWWPRGAPGDVSADPIGAMAQRRITDAAEARNPHKEMQRRAATYQPGDTDLAWTRVTLWRGLLAAALDQPPYEPVTVGDGHRRQRLPLDRPAGRLAGPDAAVPGDPGPHPPRHRHGQRPARAPQRRHRPGPARRRRRDPGATGPAGTPDHPARGGSSRSASPTSCAGWTPTRSTPSPSPGGCPRSAPAGR